MERNMHLHYVLKCLQPNKINSVFLRNHGRVSIFLGNASGIGGPSERQGTRNPVRRPRIRPRPGGGRLARQTAQTQLCPDGARPQCHTWQSAERRAPLVSSRGGWPRPAPQVRLGARPAAGCLLVASCSPIVCRRASAADILPPPKRSPQKHRLNALLERACLSMK